MWYGSSKLMMQLLDVYCITSISHLYHEQLYHEQKPTPPDAFSYQMQIRITSPGIFAMILAPHENSYEVMLCKISAYSIVISTRIATCFVAWNELPFFLI